MEILIERGYRQYDLFIGGECYSEKALGIEFEYHPKGYTQEDLSEEEICHILASAKNIANLRQTRAKLREGVPALLVNRVKSWLKYKGVRAVFVSAVGTADYEVCESVEDFVKFYINGRYWNARANGRDIVFEPMWTDIKYFIEARFGENRVDFYDEFDVEWR